MLEYFSKADRGLDIILRWIGAFTLLSAMLSWLATQVTWLGDLNWAEAIFVGLGAACVLTLVLSLALVAFRVFRPLAESRPDQAPSSDHVASGEIQTVKLKIEKLEAEITKSTEQLREQGKETNKVGSKLETLTKLMDRHTDLSSEHDQLQDDSIKSLRAELSDATTAIQAVEKRTKEIITFTDGIAIKVGDLRTDVQSIRHGSAKLEGDFKDHRQSMGEALHTIYLREITDLFAANLVECHDKMYLPLKDGKVIDESEWPEWEKLHQEWRRYLDRWIEHCRWYSDEDLKAAIIDTPDSAYGSDWKVDESQLPGAEANRIFRQFRIRHTQWEAQRDTVRANMIGVAFNGTKRSDISNG